VELHGVDVVLAEGLWRRGEARSELPTMSRRRRRAVVVGEGAPVEIGRRLGAREHEWRSGKLAEELAGAMGGRWLLPTVTRGSPERKSGGGGVGSSGCAR
jgi:hypothetical protein